ncbi:MAG: beta-N-acetylglucosaminidase, partial [Flavobacteriaceae bacterium]|nr:beta-N-acetylglucosaminidase [Flavobacteriaceae bacterium]
MRLYISLISFVLLPLFGFSQNGTNPLQSYDSSMQQDWVDDVYEKMTLEEKVGQLFMVRAFSDQDASHVESIKKLIEENHIGGLIFSKGGPVRQAKLNNKFQALSKT